MSGNRAASAVGGAIALLFVSVITLGLALLAPLGMWVAGWIMRRQKQPLTRFTSWLGAVYGVGLVIMVGMGVSMVGTIRHLQDPAFRRTVDSVRAVQRNKPAPAWIERIAPGTAARTQASQPRPGSKAESMMGVGGSIFAAVLMGTLGGMLIGSLAWWACLPLYFAINGYPLGKPPMPVAT